MKGSYWNAERGSRNIEPGTGPQSPSLPDTSVIVQLSRQTTDKENDNMAY